MNYLSTLQTWPYMVISVSSKLIIIFCSDRYQLQCSKRDYSINLVVHRVLNILVTVTKNCILYMKLLVTVTKDAKCNRNKHLHEPIVTKDATSRTYIYIHGVYRYILYAFEYLTFRINGSHPADGKLSICL